MYRHRHRVPMGDIREARGLYPATAELAYFNTAAVGSASRTLVAAYRSYVDEWAESSLDYVRGEAAGERARTAVAGILGADRSDVALIASVSAAAGLVAAHFGPAVRGLNVVIGEREYSSNHYPWQQLAYKGYEVRQVPFRNGGLEPADVARQVDEGTVLVAFSGVRTATGHRTDQAISAIARAGGAVVFVDGSQHDRVHTSRRRRPRAAPRRTPAARRGVLGPRRQSPTCDPLLHDEDDIRRVTSALSAI